MTGDLKVCNHCSKMVLRHLISMDSSSDLKSDLQELQDDLSNKFSSVNSNRGSNSMYPHRKSSVGYQEEKLISKSILYYTDLERSTNSLKLFYEEILRNIKGDITGAALIAMILTSKILPDEEQAISILNSMIGAGYLTLVDTTNYPSSTTGSDMEPTVHFNPKFIYKAAKMTDTLRRRDIRLASNINTMNSNQMSQSFDGKSINKLYKTHELETPSTQSKIPIQIEDVYLKHEENLIG